MKGVSEIIAIILILMIVIALAALAYTWFSGVFASITGNANTAINANSQEMATQFRIEAARYSVGASSSCCTNITIRNIGAQNINGSMTAAYIGGISSSFLGVCNTTPTCGSPGNINLLPQGTLVIYNITNSSVACGSTVMITIGSGLTDSRVISC